MPERSIRTPRRSIGVTALSADVGVVAEAPFGPPGSTTPAAGTISGSHVYADNGVYTVTVTVTTTTAARTSTRSR